MVKGVSIKFKSYSETVPKLLKLIKLDIELKKHNKIILKPFIRDSDSEHTPAEFADALLKFCMANKNPDAEVLIAEGADGEETMDLFSKFGYKDLAEKYAVGLVDLNTTEVEEISDGEFLKFSGILYPKVLTNSFVISMPKLAQDDETEITASLSNMLGVFPGDYYKGFFSRVKSKIRKYPIKFAIHDIIKCKMPNLALIDAADKGFILAGQPLEIDKQAAKLLEREWKSVSHIRLIDESMGKEINEKKEEIKSDKI